jgi:two-component system CheB/CheR fusion protein
MTIESARLILVVEDDAGVAILQRRRLERAHFRVVVATDVPAAMRALQQDPVDLVLLDYRLGSTTGLDLHRRMKAAGFDVPVIIVSAAMEDAMVIEAIRAGVRDVVVKSADYLEYLPDAVRAVLDQAAAVPERRREEPVGARVLVVEDDAGVAMLERRQLQRAGYQVEVAGTWDEAVRIVRQGVTNLMILDLQLGDVSGLDLHEQLRDEGWNIPAILVTGFADQSVAIRALRAGIRDLVAKSPDYLEYLPVAVDRVVQAVRVERKLAESELRLASIIGTTLDAIVMCDDHGRIILFNRSAEEMFGCTAAEALKQSLDRFIPGLSLANALQAPASEPTGTMRLRLEVVGTHADGARVPIEVSITDVVVNESRLFTVIARDVSERHRIEAALRDADRRKDEFLGMLAHELRNPLAAIMTAGEVLHRRMEDTDAQKLTSVIRRQTRALARMVDDLLDVSRVTLGKIELSKEPLLLSEVAARAAEANRESIAHARITLDLQIDSAPVWVDGDLTRLEQVLTNLLNNAVKFTPAGGTILLQARHEGDHAVVRVRDTGAGIEAALLPRVFDLFVQGDTSLARAKSGLGIGLALVHKLVRLHGGEVTAASQGPGTGAEFVIRLPISQVVGVSAPDEAAHPQQAGPRMRVLVVDDQHDIADSIAMLVEHVGHAGNAVYDGSSALDTARRMHPDVVFVDVGMPGMTGHELASEMRADPALSGALLVALTGYGRAEDRARALAAGFDVHVTKPLTEKRLREVLGSVPLLPRNRGSR